MDSETPRWSCKVWPETGRVGTAHVGQEGMEPRRFQLVRRFDPSGVSGIGVVAHGVVFGDGHVALRWLSRHPSTSLWGSLDDLLAVHGHGGSTVVAWIDQPPPGLGQSRRGYVDRRDLTASSSNGPYQGRHARSSL